MHIIATTVQSRGLDPCILGPEPATARTPYDLSRGPEPAARARARTPRRRRRPQSRVRSPCNHGVYIISLYNSYRTLHLSDMNPVQINREFLHCSKSDDAAALGTDFSQGFRKTTPRDIKQPKTVQTHFDFFEKIYLYKPYRIFNSDSTGFKRNP